MLNKLDRTIRALRKTQQTQDKMVTMETQQLASSRKREWHKINLQLMLVLKVTLRALGLPNKLNKRIKCNKLHNLTIKLDSCLLF